MKFELYSEEKYAQNLASRLEGPTFDIYLRLNEKFRKKVIKIEEEFLKEFERGQINRENASFALSNRTFNQGESSHTLVYKLIELVI